MSLGGLLDSAVPGHCPGCPNGSYDPERSVKYISVHYLLFSSERCNISYEAFKFLKGFFLHFVP